MFLAQARGISSVPIMKRFLHHHFGILQDVIQPLLLNYYAKHLKAAIKRPENSSTITLHPNDLDSMHYTQKALLNPTIQSVRVTISMQTLTPYQTIALTNCLLLMSKMNPTITELSIETKNPLLSASLSNELSPITSMLTFNRQLCAILHMKQHLSQEQLASLLKPYHVIPEGAAHFFTQAGYKTLILTLIEQSNYFSSIKFNQDVIENYRTQLAAIMPPITSDELNIIELSTNHALSRALPKTSMQQGKKIIDTFLAHVPKIDEENCSLRTRLR